MNKKKLLLILKLSVSLLVIAALIFLVDIKEFIRSVLSMPLLAFPILISTYFSTILLNSTALYILIKGKIKFRQFLKSNWVSFAVGQLSPARSGELSIVYLLKKRYGIPPGKVAASFIVYKMLVLTTLIILSFLMSFTYLGFLDRWYYGLFIALLVIILAVITIKSRFIRGLIKRFILRKHAKVMKGFNKYFSSLLKDFRTLSLSFLINLLKLSYNALAVMVVLKLMGIDAPFLMVIGINAVTLIASLVPLSISGIGFKESAAVILFSMLGISGGAVASIYIIITSIYLIINTIMLVFFLNN